MVLAAVLHGVWFSKLLQHHQEMSVEMKWGLYSIVQTTYVHVKCLVMLQSSFVLGDLHTVTADNLRYFSP